ncbi:hypothetical protein BD770DRAFT_424119 [Pilaira anomala]|nr:hypothetical protein BD770DRAFT_424119 [Pilaira anomala]
MTYVICEKVKARYLEQFKSCFKENIITDSAAKAIASATLIDACAAVRTDFVSCKRIKELLDIFFRGFHNFLCGSFSKPYSIFLVLFKYFTIATVLLSLHFSYFDLQFHRTRSG